MQISYVANRRILLKALLVLFILLPFGFSNSAMAYCGEDIIQSLPKHYVHRGYCGTKDAAMASCVALAAEHGYPASYCMPQERTIGHERIEGGWFMEQKGITKEPFHFAEKYYTVAKIPKPFLQQGAPDCEEQCFGDPINAGTGNKFEEQAEWVGAASSPLKLSLMYNASFDAGYIRDGALIFGRLRAHTYARSVIWLRTQAGGQAYVARPNGNAAKFELVGGAWMPVHGGAHRLVETFNLSGIRIAWTFNSDSGDEETYDANGRLVRIVQRNGQTQDLTYSYQGCLSTVTDQSGRRLKFTCNTSGLVTKVDFPDGQYITLTYTSRYLSSIVRSDGTAVQYLYNESGLVDSQTGAGALTGVLDEHGGRVSTTRYAKRFATSTYVGSGRRLTSATYVADVGGRYAASAVVTSENGSSRSMTFDVVDGRVVPSTISVACPGCVTRSRQLIYGAGHKPERINEADRSSEFSYDAVGRITERREFDGNNTLLRRTAYGWHGFDRSLASIATYDGAGTLVDRREWSFNDRGQKLADSKVDVSSGATRASMTAYCEASDVAAGVCPLVGLIKQVDGARTDLQDQLAFSYYMLDASDCATSPTACAYRKGDLRSIRDASGGVTEVLRYDGAGRVKSIKSPNGVVTDVVYHPRGWVVATKMRGEDSASELDDAVTLYEYTGRGLIKKVTNPDGQSMFFEHDDADRLVSVSDGAGNEVSYTLDNAGHRIKEDTKGSFGQLKRTLSRIYNSLGQLTTLADGQANPTDFTYDAIGNTRTVTDALSHTTANDYDPLNRLKRTLQDVGGIEAETKFEYDANDNLTKVTDPKGLDTTYTYNGFGDQVQLSSPDTGITTFTYDSAGNRASQTDARGITTTYQYDALNRLTQVGYPTSSLNVSYTYDVTQPVCQAGETFSVGRLTLMVDGSGSTQYCHDRFGQLVRKVQTTNGVALTLQYAYTKGGQLQAMTYPDGTVVDYLRNAQGQITEVGVAQPSQAREVLLTQATYHPFGPIAGWVYGNGRVMQRNVDLDYRPTSIQGGPGGLDLTYGYDAVGNLTSLSSGSPPPLEYGYDALGRLTESRDGPTQAIIDQYTYDKTGNRTSFTDSLGTKAYAYPSTSHRLSSVAGESRTYDAVGNTLSIGAARELRYNDAGRMSQVRKLGFVAMEYTYNGQGEQVRKHLGATEALALYDEGGHWVGSYGSSGTVFQQVIWMNGLPVGVLEDSHVYYIQADHLATPRNVIDSMTDTAVWEWESKGEAFGITMDQQDPDGNGIPFALDLRMPGQRQDVLLGLTHNGFRQYDPTTGRFIQSDLLGLADGPSTYSYGQSNPLKNSDPSGLATATMPWGAASSSTNWAAVRLVASRLGPLAFAGSAGFALGTGMSNGYEQVFGDSIGGDIFDLFDRPSMMADPNSIVEGLNGRTDGKVTIPWPPKTPGLWTCICRAQSLNRLEGCEASTGYGLGMDATISGARKKAETLARLAVKGGVDFHHTQCKCTGPKGEQVNY